MPRLSPGLLRYAALRNRHLPQLLRECRDLESATNELRWLAEYASSKQLYNNNTSSDARLTHYVQRRSRGEPLQYILGTQPFGELDILCRKDVLIPRPETEAYTTTLAGLLKELRKEGVIDPHRTIDIADLCTGTGCIALLLYSLLVPQDTNAQPLQAPKLLGVDVSPHALRLANDNLRHNFDAGLLNPNCKRDVGFESINVLELGQIASQADSRKIEEALISNQASSCFLSRKWDVIISNPPYISPPDYAPGGTVSRSVRNHEPKLALVPPPQPVDAQQRAVCQADRFYEALIHIARKVGANALLMEVGDSQQASRVKALATNLVHNGLIEVWRDDGSVGLSGKTSGAQTILGDAKQPEERAVVVWTGPWAEWRRIKMTTISKTGSNGL